MAVRRIGRDIAVTKFAARVPKFCRRVRLRRKGYCEEAIDYVQLRTRMAFAIEEKSRAFADTASVMLSLSKEVGQLLDKISVACGESVALL